MPALKSLRPTVPTRGAVVISAMSVVLFVIARTTGSGWLVVVFCGLLATLAVSFVLPAIDVARVRASVAAGADAVAGRPVTVTVRVEGARRPLRLRLLSPSSSWAAVEPPAAGPVNAVPARRGFLAEIELEVRSAAPLGLLGWRRRLRLPLRRPIDVAPAPQTVNLPAAGPKGAPDRPAAGVALAGGEVVRGVRDYVQGDPQRLVSWTATARHQQLMVKELENPAHPRLVLTVDLGDGSADVQAVEDAASRAAGMAAAGLAAGMPVVLCTAETSGPRTAAVTSALEAGRRLARAVPGPLSVPPSGPAEMVITVRPE